MSLKGRDVVEWLILKKLMRLSSKEKDELVSEYFDQRKFYREILKMYEDKVSKGEEVVFDELLGRYRPKGEVRSKRKKRNNNKQVEAFKKQGSKNEELNKAKGVIQ